MYFLDKRVVESRKIMVETAVDLLQIKPMHKVSIKELCEKSGVARSTFYRNHRSIEQLFIKRLQDWYYITFDEVFSGVKPVDDLNLKFFKACEKDFEFFKVVYRCNLDGQAITELQKCINSAVKIIFEREDSIRETSFYKNYPYSLYAFMGVAQMSIRYWIENDTLSAEDITKLFLSVNLSLVDRPNS
jgi:AcrR family transcriptional regulator